MSTTPSLKERLHQIVCQSYYLLCNKIAGRNIEIENEASLQMQLAVLMKQVGQLYEFHDTDRFSLLQDLENLEQYKALDPSVQSCYEIVYTDNPNYTKEDSDSKIQITPTISSGAKLYKDMKVNLMNTYTTCWDSYQPSHYFLKIEII